VFLVAVAAFRFVVCYCTPSAALSAAPTATHSVTQSAVRSSVRSVALLLLNRGLLLACYSRSATRFALVLLLLADLLLADLLLADLLLALLLSLCYSRSATPSATQSAVWSAAPSATQLPPDNSVLALGLSYYCSLPHAWHPSPCFI
jgi:hypothetical protein